MSLGYTFMCSFSPLEVSTISFVSVTECKYNPAKKSTHNSNKNHDSRIKHHHVPTTKFILEGQNT